MRSACEQVVLRAGGQGQRGQAAQPVGLRAVAVGGDEPVLEHAYDVGVERRGAGRPPPGGGVRRVVASIPIATASHQACTEPAVSVDGAPALAERVVVPAGEALDPAEVGDEEALERRAGRTAG